MKRNPKVFMALAALALVGGGAGSYFQWSSLQEVQAKSAELRQRMQEPSKVQRQLVESTAKVAEFSAKLNHLEKGVPQMAYVATLLAELDKIGTQNGIDVLGVRPVAAAVTPANVAKSADSETSAPKKPYEELNIEVKGRGDYAAVRNFVQALQSFPKIVAARTVSITPKVSQGKGALKLDIAIELRAYLFPGAQPSTPAASTGSTIQISGRNKEIL